MQSFKNALSNCDWTELFRIENVDRADEVFEKSFFEAYEKCFPFVTKKRLDKKRSEYIIDFFNPELEIMRKKT